MKKTKGYQKRFYRVPKQLRGLVNFTIAIKETDLFIFAEDYLFREAEELVLKYRNQLETYIEKKPFFIKSMSPFEDDPFAPEIIKEMIKASKVAGVGPMASVAGVIAEAVGRGLIKYSKEVIVENGGDLFLKVLDETLVGIYAGISPLSGKLALRIDPEMTPIGICTSSGKVGHSFSMGNSDAVTVVSKSTALADAVATRIGNLIHSKDDIAQGLKIAQSIKGVEGVIIIIDDNFGVWGDLKIEEANLFKIQS